MTKIYAKKASATKNALKTFGKEAKEGADYKIREKDGGFVVSKVRAATEKKERDQFGFAIGNNRNIAALMLLKGCTMAEVKTKTGYSQYNTLKALKDQGHTIESKDGKLKLIVKKAGAKASPSKAKTTKAKDDKKTSASKATVTKTEDEKTPDAKTEDSKAA